jgi:hypothetical protein
MVSELPLVPMSEAAELEALVADTEADAAEVFAELIALPTIVIHPARDAVEEPGGINGSKPIEVFNCCDTIIS